MSVNASKPLCAARNRASHSDLSFSAWGVSGHGACQGIGRVRARGTSGHRACQSTGRVRARGVSEHGACQGTGRVRARGVTGHGACSGAVKALHDWRTALTRYSGRSRGPSSSSSDAPSPLMSTQPPPADQSGPCTPPSCRGVPSVKRESQQPLFSSREPHGASYLFR